MSKAAFAALFPFFADSSSLVLREDTIAISDIEKTPFSSTNNNIISISIFKFLTF
jgi:hypothetical protein